ncbi:Ig-like domain-containing protein [Paenibacillus aestuarii]|uniref:Ig-like domain-containing protein n=1 Tax=Paenibacillus aestuarii TaxID=516965 RepID=A0ABW0K6R3_9BACL|nr:Ig-like domain-containing protein [Paenibacillus aestuarii]
MMIARKSKLLLLPFLLIFAFISSFGSTALAADEISRLVLNKNELTMEVGDTLAMTATAVYESGSTETVTVKTDWNSSANDVAAVYAGSVTAKKAGTAVITATYSDKTVIVNVTVNKHVRSLIKDKQSVDLRLGQSDQITLTAYYDDGTNEDVTQKAEWSFDKDAIATVVNGKITGLSSGTATLTAQYNNRSVTIPVNVEIVKRLEPDQSQLSLLLHDSQTIKLTATFPDGSVEDVTDKAEWESDHPDIADVLKGKITGYGPGQAMITATYGTQSVEIKTDVDKAIKLDLDQQQVYMKKNSTTQLQLTASYADGSTNNIADRADWSSSDESVVYVDKGKLVANATGEATITAKYGERSVTATVDVDVAKRLTISQESLSMKTTDTPALTLSAAFNDGTTADVTNQATWKVSDDNILDVTNGKITAFKAGEATITASFGGKSVSSKIYVDIPTYIKASKKNLDFQVGSYEQIGLTAVYSGSSEADVTNKAEWTTSDSSVAEVSNGLITAVGKGSATVTAKYGTRTVTVQVSVGILKSLTSDKDSISNIVLKKGDSQAVAVTATYTDGTTAEVSKDAVWTSSNTKAVTVSEGVLKAVAAGETVITAEYGGKSLTLNVQVDMASTLAPNVTSIAIDIGETKAIVITATDVNGNTSDVTSQAQWTSSTPAVATVAAGTVTAVANGKTTVTATYGGKTVTIPVEVGAVQTVDTDKKFISMKTGDSVQVNLTAMLANGSKKDVSTSGTWKSSNYKVVSVDNGLVTAVGSGKANISGTYNGKTISIPVEVDTLKYLKTDIVNVEMKLGATYNVKATATYADQSEQDVTLPALWKSNNIRIADVKDGVIQANGKGKAVISVTFGNMKTTVYVTIKE